MIHSMTGFGRCRMTVDGLDVLAEIKSVNSRYLDCNVRISRDFSHLEPQIKPFLQASGISRGKVDVTITVERTENGDGGVTLDETYLRGYLDALHHLRDTYGLRDDISVMTVAQNPLLFRSAKPEEDVERDWSRVRTVLDEAVKQFLAVRRREGDALVADLREKIARIGETVERIEALSACDVATYRERLAERIREALADNQITPDESRLLTECAIHADKIAVDEELVRLRTHIGAFLAKFDAKTPVGRELDFLLQEMNREINTTGSKCANAEVAGLVISVKCELEKIREQIQNLE